MTPTGKDNRRTAFFLGAASLCMVGLAFASVPLYRVFCQVTGYGGTPRIERMAQETEISAATITMRFDAGVNSRLGWRFRPLDLETSIHPGETRLTFFVAENLEPRPVTGTATFNVTPHKAAPYFIKLECFCFTEQKLEPGQRIEMPVQYSIDPAILTDPNTRDIRTVTLSYTFFPARGGT